MSDDILKAGMSAERIERVRQFIRGYIDAGKHFGAEIMVARNGHVALHETFGFREPERDRPLPSNAVYSIFSVTKTFTSVLTLMAIEKGLLSLTTKVSEVIPEFRGGRREDVTVYHLLTHQSGLPMTFTPVPGMYIDRLDEVIEAICKSIRCETEPGVEASYSPTVNHCLLGEMVRRVDPQKRRFRDIASQDLLEPLKMKDTSFGLRRDLKERHIKPTWLWDKTPLKHLGHSNYGPDGAFEEEDAEMPWVAGSTTVSNLFRLAEALPRGGELDGARILSP